MPSQPRNARIHTRADQTYGLFHMNVDSWRQMCKNAARNHTQAPFTQQRPQEQADKPNAQTPEVGGIGSGHGLAKSRGRLGREWNTRRMFLAALMSRSSVRRQAGLEHRARRVASLMSMRVPQP